MENNITEPLVDEQFQKVKNLAKEAYRLIEQKRFREAKEKLSILLEEDPKNTYGLVGMGDVLYKTKSYDEAIEYYKRCLSENSSNKFSLMGLLNCYREQNQLKRVIETAEQYRHITITDASILSRVADSHRKLKNYKESEVFYMAALQINPQDHYVIVGLGHLYFACQRYQDAILWWDKLLVNQPNNIKILTEIGNSYRKIKDFDRAIEYYDRAQNLDSNNFFALYGLAESYRGKKDFRKAIIYWEKILDNDPENKLIVNRYADSLRGLGEYDKALDCFNRILSSGDDYFALLGKASSLKLKGNYEESEEILNQLISRYPQDPRPIIEIAELFFTIGNRDKAIRILEDYTRKFPNNDDILSKLEQFQSEE
jgi:tetratricopeptide (TPR) repeat protein